MSQWLVLATRDGVGIAQREEDGWAEVNQSLAARQVTSVSVEGSALVAGTTEGVFRSDDMGQTWHVASEGLTHRHVRWLAHAPGESGRVLVGTEPAAIFLSRDGGEHWTECPEVAALRDEHGWYLPYSPEAGCVRGFAFHGQRVYAAVEQGGLLRSDDGGESWWLVEGSNGIPRTPPPGMIHPDVHSVVVHPLSADWVLAPTGGGLYGSKDGGATWSHLYRSYCRAAWWDPARMEHVVFGPADGVDRNGRIEESEDEGKTWQAASEGMEVPWPRHMVERLTPVGAELVAVLSNGDVWAAPLATLRWRRVVRSAGWVRAVAAMTL